MITTKDLILINRKLSNSGKSVLLEIDGPELGYYENNEWIHLDFIDELIVEDLQDYVDNLVN